MYIPVGIQGSHHHLEQPSPRVWTDCVRLVEFLTNNKLNSLGQSEKCSN